MSAVAAALKWMFILASISSAIGFWKAKTISKSNGPTKPIADFSAFMAYSFGAYLFVCLALTAIAVFSHDAGALFYGALFCAPFAIAGLANEYQQADAAFHAQIVILLTGLIWLVSRG